MSGSWIPVDKRKEAAAHCWDVLDLTTRDAIRKTYPKLEIAELQSVEWIFIKDEPVTRRVLAK